MFQNSSFILSGSPFKVATQSIIIFLCLLTLMGDLLVNSVTTTLKSELHARLHEESLLLQDIYETEGINGLKQAMQPFFSSERIYDIFNNKGISLTGKIPQLPDIAVSDKVIAFSLPHSDGQYWGHFHRLDEQTTLVVGRSDDIIELAKERLIIGLLICGAIYIIAALLVGYFFSQKSSYKLEQFEKTLTHVADGDLSARLPVSSSPEQIDVIADKVNRQLERLQHLVSSIDNTSKAIAHDLKTPLSRAQIALFSALDACDNGEDPAFYVQKALDENIHLNELFETLLRISRLQTQMADKSTFSRFSLRPVLQEVIEFLSPNAEINQQQLCLDCSKDLQVTADKAMLQQALINLANNAIVHSGQQTTITLSAKISQQAVLLCVCDTGKGIAEDDRDKVLEPFARLDNARHTAGNGLGLALVSAIVDYHSGSIQLQPNTPTGLCAGIKLPLH